MVVYNTTETNPNGQQYKPKDGVHWQDRVNKRGDVQDFRGLTAWSSSPLLYNSQLEQHFRTDSTTTQYSLITKPLLYRVISTCSNRKITML